MFLILSSIDLYIDDQVTGHLDICVQEWMIPDDQVKTLTLTLTLTFMIQACTQKLVTFQARPHKLIKQHNDPCLIYSAKFQAFS